MLQPSTILPLLLLALACAGLAAPPQQPLAAPLVDADARPGACALQPPRSRVRASHLTAPAPAGPRRPLQGRFLHVTDIHPDPHYRVGASAKKACHRGAPKAGKPAAGHYGLAYRCVLDV